MTIVYLKTKHNDFFVNNIWAGPSDLGQLIITDTEAEPPGKHFVVKSPNLSTTLTEQTMTFIFELGLIIYFPALSTFQSYIIKVIETLQLLYHWYF